MLEKILENGSKYLDEKMDNPDSLLYKALQTTQNIEKSTNLIRKSYAVLFSLFALFLIHTGLCIYNLRDTYVPGNIFLLVVLTLGSILLFVFSTNYDEYNFYNRKKVSIVLIILYIALTADSIISKLFCWLLLPILLMIPISPDISVGMVVSLSRVTYLLATLLPGILIIYKLCTAMIEPNNWDRIAEFKIRKHVDFRKDKEFSYDLHFIRYMETGRRYTIKQKDRQRHILLSGVTGTGKTSSAMIPAVAEDLDHKAHNEDYCKKELLSRIITHKDIYPDKKLTDENYNIELFHATTPEAEKFIEALKHKSPSAGMTVVAPNADFADAVYSLATSRGFVVNRIDPIPENPATGELKPGFKGFNPFYISPHLPPAIHYKEVFTKSRMTSDVLQSIFDQSGKTDPYFTQLNRNLTSVLAILIITTYPYLHPGEQPTLIHLQEVVNDFDRIRPYLFALCKMKGIEDPKVEKPADITSAISKHDFEEYQFVVTQICTDLLGSGRQQMEGQIRGLRNIINEFLTDPYVRNLLCAKDCVDIDETLSRGEITVFNYALELGLSVATGLGLFYCLSFNQAVLRRPGNEDSRLLHFYICDEFPVLLHRDMEQIFTLFRQFKTAFLCAFQTFSQFDKTDVTRYLKNVIISNTGHHVVYGNCSPEEMKLYQDLAGKELKFIEQDTINQTALSSSDTSLSYSTRITPSMENAMEGYKLRRRDFQEVTVFGINNGDHQDPFIGKVSFLSKEARKGPDRCYIDWERYKIDVQEDADFIQTFETASRKIPAKDVASSGQQFLNLDVVSGLNYRSIINNSKDNYDVIANTIEAMSGKQPKKGTETAVGEGSMPPAGTNDSAVQKTADTEEFRYD